MIITIRNAKYSDSDGLLHLLEQIAAYHKAGRPDIFKAGCAKYTKGEIEEILDDEYKPVFVAADESNNILGYVFCKVIKYKSHAVFNDYNSLYIDDFCVDESVRGQHIGKRLFETVKHYAKELGVYNITLNVWEFNENAMKFYESCGMTTQRRNMEFIFGFVPNYV